LAELHRNARRVQETLAAAGSSAVVRELPDSAATVALAAAALGVSEGQIAKSLVFLADGEPVLAVLSGPDRLDTRRLASHLGVRRVERADADAVRRATGFPIGGVSPVGHPGNLRIIVDRGLEAFDVVWAAAGTPHAVCSRSAGARPATWHRMAPRGGSSLPGRRPKRSRGRPRHATRAAV
jgi:prolyl-tRNA editing enzyme YbaK/EbsC (Cys-tRNA(Pro) deacylase)